MYAGVWIASKPFVPFFITPNGDMARVCIISNEGTSKGTFVLDWAVAS